MAQITETYAVGNQQVTVALSVDLPAGATYQLTAADMANPTPVLAAIPSGTALAPVTVLLPAGEFLTDVSFDVSDKAWWVLRGGPTTLRFPTYGPITSGTTYGRRHVRISRVTDSHFSGISVRGPHTGRHPTDPTRAISTTTDPAQAKYEFQHGFQIGECARVTIEDLSVLEVGGDGLYFLDSDDLTVNRLRIEFNGRQGLAGIQGNRLVFNELEVVNAGRYAIDIEPIGALPNGQTRWVTDMDVTRSKLKGGVILHRVTNVTIGGVAPSGNTPGDGNEMRRGGVIVEAGSTTAGNIELSQRRTGIKILNNVWPELWSSPTADAGPIRLNTLNGVEVRGNTVNRDPAYAPSANAPLVEMISGPVNGHFVVRGNNTNLTQLLKWRNFDHSNVTEDVGP